MGGRGRFEVYFARHCILYRLSYVNLGWFHAIKCHENVSKYLISLLVVLKQEQKNQKLKKEIIRSSNSH